MADLRLLIVAADTLSRAGLTSLFSELPAFGLIGQMTPGDVVLAEFDDLAADIILWDFGWEPEEQLDLLVEAITEWQVSDPAIVVLLPDQELVRDLWSAGISSILLRDAPIESLSAAVAAAANDLMVIEPSFMSSLVSESAVQDQGPVEDLTPREIEVLGLVAEGFSNKAIAIELAISEHTVKFHLNALMGKLDVQSRTAAVVRATRLGLIAL